VRQAIEEGAHTFEWPGVRQDGSEFWAEVHLAPVELDGQDRVLASVRDVTERRHYQAELELQERRFRYLEAVADIGYWELDARSEATPVVTASDGVYHLHDLQPEAEFDLEEGIEFYHPDDRPRIREAVKRAVSEGEPYDLEARLITASGRKRSVHAVGEPVVNDGEIELVRGVIQDITAQRELETRLEEVYERITDAFYALDEEFRFTHVNDRTEELMRASADELLGNSVWEMFPEAAESDLIWNAFHAAMDEQIPQSFDIYYDPLEFHAEATVYPSESGLSVFFRDVGEQKEYERQLERQYKRLDEFTSVVSHDLRNPLSVAQGRLELALEECDSEHLDSVHRALERMDTLIHDLLMLAREGKKLGTIQTVDLACLAERCWQNIANAEATLAIESERDIRADTTRLQQLLDNLIRNAVEHGGDDVTVTIGELDDGFYVEDDGPGISEGDRDEVFEAGYSTSKEGTGFGLSIVKQVADAHGWEIRLEAGSAGGARFEITGVELGSE
jgi:PAS domain S-box-containing protein